MKIETEAVETDDTQPLPDAPDIPDFLTGKDDAKPKSHVSVEDLADLVSMCLSVVVYIHESLVLVTDYDKFALNEADQALWRTVLKFLFKDIDIKYLPVVIAIAGIGMMETMKVMGYFKWKKGMTSDQAVPTAKKGFVDAPTG